MRRGHHPIVTGTVDQAALAALAAELRATGTGARPPGTPRPGRAGPAARDPAPARRRVLSGPGGLAAFLRTRLTGDQFPSVSLPLDTGTPTSLITGGLRRAVIARDRHCAFPGCDTPPAACQVHHIKPSAKGGQTSLTNLVLLCAFHHLWACPASLHLGVEFFVDRGAACSAGWCQEPVSTTREA